MENRVYEIINSGQLEFQQNSITKNFLIDFTHYLLESVKHIMNSIKKKMDFIVKNNVIMLLFERMVVLGKRLPE